MHLCKWLFSIYVFKFFVQKLNRLTSTTKAQKYYCQYNLGKTIIIENRQDPTKEELAWLPFQKSNK